MKRGLTVFDLETTDLKANWGHLLAACFLPLESDTVDVFRLDDPKYRNKKDPFDDGKLVVAIRDYMEDCFGWIGWNSKLFDVAWIRTRLAMKGERQLTGRMHLDLMYFARKPYLALHSSRLEAVVDTFQLGVKTHMTPDIWVKAQKLEKGAMDYVVDHCTEDVKSTKEAFKVLSPFIKNIHF